MNESRFRVSHMNQSSLGIATMRERRVTFKADPKRILGLKLVPMLGCVDFKQLSASFAGAQGIGLSSPLRKTRHPELRSNGYSLTRLK